MPETESGGIWSRPNKTYHALLQGKERQIAQDLSPNMVPLHIIHFTLDHIYSNGTHSTPSNSANRWESNHP